MRQDKLEVAEDQNKEVLYYSCKNLIIVAMRGRWIIDMGDN